MKTSNRCMLKSNHMIHKELFDCNGEKLGEVAGLIIDKISGNQQFIVMETKASPHSEGKLYVIPWKYLANTEESGLTLNLTSVQLKSLTELDRKIWLDNNTFIINNKDFEMHEAATYPSLTPFPNANNNEQLESIMLSQPEQTEREILVKIDKNGFNQNPSEQHAYPGPQQLEIQNLNNKGSSK